MIKSNMQLTCKRPGVIMLMPSVPELVSSCVGMENVEATSLVVISKKALESNLLPEINMLITPNSATSLDVCGVGCDVIQTKKRG